MAMGKREIEVSPLKPYLQLSSFSCESISIYLETMEHNHDFYCKVQNPTNCNLNKLSQKTMSIFRMSLGGTGHKICTLTAQSRSGTSTVLGRSQVKQVQSV